MLGTIEQEKIGNTIKAQWGIYFAFLMSVFMYLLVLLKITASRPAEPRQVEMAGSIFIALSIIAGMAKFWVQGRHLTEVTYYRQCQTLDEILKRYTNYFALVLAACQLPALFGLIIVFMTLRLGEWWLFMGISLVLYATSIPRGAKLRYIVEAHAARHQADIKTFAGELKTEADIVREALVVVGDFTIPSLLRRIFAFVIDMCLLIAISVLLLKMPTLERYEGIRLMRYALYLALFFYIFYHAFCVRFLNGTVGCVFCGLKVVSVDASRLDLSKALVRGFLLLVTVVFFFPLFLLIEWLALMYGIRKGKNQYKQTSWDKASKTIVVRPA